MDDEARKPTEPNKKKDYYLIKLRNKYSGVNLHHKIT